MDSSRNRSPRASGNWPGVREPRCGRFRLPVYLRTSHGRTIPVATDPRRGRAAAQVVLSPPFLAWSWPEREPVEAGRRERRTGAGRPGAGARTVGCPEGGAPTAAREREAGRGRAVVGAGRPEAAGAQAIGAFSAMAGWTWVLNADNVSADRIATTTATRGVDVGLVRRHATSEVRGVRQPAGSRLWTGCANAVLRFRMVRRSKWVRLGMSLLRGYRRAAACGRVRCARTGLR